MLPGGIPYCIFVPLDNLPLVDVGPNTSKNRLLGWVHASKSLWGPTHPSMRECFTGMIFPAQPLSGLSRAPASSCKSIVAFK